MFAWAATMARLLPYCLLPALVATAASAGEMTVGPRPFSVSKSFTAAALPTGEGVPLRLESKAWIDFKVAKLADHGSKVTKGDTLVAFDTEDIDRKLVDSRRGAKSATLALAQAEADGKLLQETAPHRLEAIRLAAEIAKDDNAYFTNTRRKANEEAVEQSLKRSQQVLENQNEELRQLSKMYEADDITEETEEIILTRQRNSVASAEFALRMEMLEHKRRLEVSIPREAKSLADSERDTAIALAKAETDIPRGLEQNKLGLETQRTATTRAKENLAELEADRKLFEMKAPADGWFYYGAIEDGRWTTGEILKSLVPRGQMPLYKTFATFVPVTADLALVSFLDDATARVLTPDAQGIATLAGREDVEIPVKLAKLAPAPAPDGTYRADFTVTWPEDLRPAAGAPVQIMMISYQQPAAIFVPTKALDFGNAGWTIEVKLADGKTERRPVKRGRVSKEDTEIISGLEAGQVIVVP